MPTVGIIGLGELADLLRDAGVQVIGGGDFRSSATSIRDRLDQGHDCPVLTLDDRQPGIVSWLDRTSKRTEVAIVRTDGGDELTVDAAIDIATPTTVDDALATIGVEPLGGPDGAATIGADGTIAAEAAPEPDPSNEPEPAEAAPKLPSDDGTPSEDGVAAAAPAPKFKAPTDAENPWADPPADTPAAADPWADSSQTGQDDQTEPDWSSVDVAPTQNTDSEPAAASPPADDDPWADSTADQNQARDQEPAVDPPTAGPPDDGTEDPTRQQDQQPAPAAETTSEPEPAPAPDLASSTAVEPATPNQNTDPQPADGPTVCTHCGTDLMQVDDDWWHADSRSMKCPDGMALATPADTSPTPDPPAAPAAPETAPEPSPPPAPEHSTPPPPPPSPSEPTPTAADPPPANPEPAPAGRPAATAAPTATSTHPADLAPVLFSGSGKGGVSKTTMSLLLAHRASEKGGQMRVILVDGNRGQGDIGTYLRMDVSNLPTVYDAAVTGDPSAAILAPNQVTQARHPKLAPVRFGLVLAPTTDDQADPSIVTIGAYRNVIEHARLMGDLVIIDTQIVERADTSGMVDDLMVPYLTDHAWLLMSSSLGSASMDNTLWRLKDFADRGVPANRALLTLTAVRNSRTYDQDKIEQLFAKYAVFVGETVDDEQFANQMNVGTVDSASPSVRPVLDETLWRITGRDEFNPANQPAEPDDGPSLLNRLVDRFRRR